MVLLSEYLSSWANYYESARNESGDVIDTSEMSTKETSLADVAVFGLLENLSILGLIGNTAFLWIIFINKHYRKPSYILLSSLAFADIIHCLVMASYFYPPIVTKTNLFGRLVSRITMSIEWAAWGVTLSHMLALSTDRFVAVCFCYRYSIIVTPYRALIFVCIVWTSMLALNIGVLIEGHCCLIIPAPGYYTFTFEKAPRGTLNIYQKIFVPFESLAFAAIGVVTPLTLFKYRLLRRRVKRDGNNRSMNGTNHVTRPSMSKRESKVLLQIVVVTLIFFLYMINYYLFYYIIGLTSKWETLFNSLLYCFNSMVHPFIYFGFNRLLRKQLIDCLSGLVRCNRHNESLEESRPLRRRGSPTDRTNCTTSGKWPHRLFTRLSNFGRGLGVNTVDVSSTRKQREESIGKRRQLNKKGTEFEMAPIVDGSTM